MVRYWNRLAQPKPLLFVLVSLLLLTGPFSIRTSADQLMPRSLTVGNSFAGTASVNYRFQFTYATTGPVGSLRFLFCDDTALVDLPCNPPPGFDASLATAGAQQGATGFSILPGSPANQIILSRVPAVVGAGTAGMYDFAAVTNPANPGPMYARIYTYPTSDASGTYTDAGAMALYFIPSVAVNAEVPPYLLFCLGESITAFNCSTATDPFSDVGILGSLVTGAAQTQIVVATNAQNGYSMWVLGNTMTSGSNVIPAMSGAASQKGVGQFGINLRANVSPIVGADPNGPGAAGATANYNQPNLFRFQSGDTLITTNLPDDYRKFTVSYIVNVPATQPGGVYSTTLTYVTLANF